MILVVDLFFVSERVNFDSLRNELGRQCTRRAVVFTKLFLLGEIRELTEDQALVFNLHLRRVSGCSAPSNSIDTQLCCP